MVDYVQMVMDLLMFKLAFHTYEALRNKIIVKQRLKDGSIANDDFELISNRSDETTMTTSGVDAHQKEMKYMKIEENLNIKLNQYLMKWIIIVIYYKLTWIYGILGWILPMMKLCKLLVAMWILLPQFKGEFFLWHILEGQLLYVEKYIVNMRIKASSYCTSKAFQLSNYMLNLCLTHISWECIQEIEQMADKAVDLIDVEIKQRDVQNKQGTEGFSKENRRDTQVIRDFQDHTRFNNTMGGPGGQMPSSGRMRVQDFSAPQGMSEREMMNRTYNPRHNYDVQEMPTAGMPYMQQMPDEHFGYDDNDNIPLNQSINPGQFAHSRAEYDTMNMSQRLPRNMGQDYSNFRNQFDGQGSVQGMPYNTQNQHLNMPGQNYSLASQHKRVDSNQYSTANPTGKTQSGVRSTRNNPNTLSTGGTSSKPCVTKKTTGTNLKK